MSNIESTKNGLVEKSSEKQIVSPLDETDISAFKKLRESMIENLAALDRLLLEGQEL